MENVEEKLSAYDRCWHNGVTAQGLIREMLGSGMLSGEMKQRAVAIVQAMRRDNINLLTALRTAQKG